MRYVVTITDNIGQSNMPFHEFACYRYSHFYDEHQVVFVMGNEKNDSEIPKGLDVRHIGTNLLYIRREIKKVLSEANNSGASIVFHVHEAKSVIRLFLCIGFKVKNNTIYTVHSTYSGYPIKNKIMAYCATLLSNVVTCVSETSFQYFPKSLKKIKRDNLVVVQNGVDIERIDRIVSKASSSQIPRPLLTLIYTARLIQLKDHERLIRVLSQLPEYRLLLFGEGPLRGHLEELCKRLQVGSRVQFLGIKPRNEVFTELKKADAYITTSTLEGLPISLLEAMVCSLPCFTSNIEQHQEVQNKCPSLIVFSDDEEMMKELRRFANMSKEMRKLIGKKTREEVIEEFSLSEMHKKFSTIYKLVERS